MKNKKYIDKKRRLSFLKYEFFLNVCKFILLSNDFSFTIKKSIYFDLLLLDNVGSLVRIRNLCYFTGRSHGNFFYLKMSRIKMKELISLGKLPGFLKSSW